MTALLLPLVLLGVVELGLRLFGFGYPTSFFLKLDNGYIENQDFTRRYFPPGLARAPQPIIRPARKPAGTFRIFVFGESAAMGDPEPAFGFPRILEVLLRERMGRPVEVVNVAVTAINSHVIRQIAADCRVMEGDLWIIYMGNNEVVGPFGAGTVFGAQVPGRAFIRLTTAFKTTRVGQLLSQFRRPKTPATWEGMEMFLNQQVHQDDPRMARVYAHFERNLTDIIRLASGRVLLSTVGSNLKDCPPFASLHWPDLGPADKAEWDKLFQAGDYHAAAKLDDSFAELQFRLGQYERARDLDTLRFRADSRINEIIRASAKRHGASLVDFASRANDAMFYEHVHLTFEGNYLLARALAEEILRTNSWPSLKECAALLAYTEWNKHQIVDEMVKRLELPPFTNQSNHAERLQRFRDLRTSLEATFKPEHHDGWVQTYRAAVGRAPKDWVLHENFAKLLQSIGDPAGAEHEWRAVTELLPHSASAWYGLGNVLDGQGKSGAALECFQRALKLKPGAIEARNGLGLALASQGRTNEAVREYQTALRQKPDFAEARVNLGLVLAHQGKRDEAMAEYRAALRVNSNSVAARVNLGNALTGRNDSEALAHFAEAVRLKPDLAEAQYLYGMALTKAGRHTEAIEHLWKATELRPQLAEAHFNLGVSLAKQQRFTEAVREFEETLRLEPANAMARKYLEQAQARATRP